MSTRASNTVYRIRQTDFSYSKANAAFESANNVAPQIQPAFSKANSGYTHANAGFIQANSAYETINTNPVLNRGQYIQANNTINFNVAITSNGSDIAGGLSPFLLMGA